MSYINTIGDHPSIRAYHEETYRRAGFVPHIVEAMSLRPEVLLSWHTFSRTLTFGGSSLGRRREEMVSMYVSSLLNCRY